MGTFLSPSAALSRQPSCQASRQGSFHSSRDRDASNHALSRGQSGKAKTNDVVGVSGTESVLQAAADRIAHLHTADAAVPGSDLGSTVMAAALGRTATAARPVHPVVEATKARAAKPTHCKAAAGGKEDAGQPRKLLLVVDDSDLTRKMLCRILKAQGYDYEEAEDGAVAVEKVERNIGDCAVMETGAGAGVGTGRNAVVRPYSAILMDFVMPVMDGPKATRKIRAMGCQVPVFGVTGNGQDFDVARFLESGANKVFTKPLDVAAFKECMREAEAEAAAAAAGRGGGTTQPSPPVPRVSIPDMAMYI